MSKDVFLSMAEVYKEAPCPECKSPRLIYVGYTFIDGAMAGKLHIECSICSGEYDLNVYSLKNSDILH